METSAKPWKGICCKACWFAKGNRCRCRCKGANHQHGLTKQLLYHQGMPKGETDESQYDCRFCLARNCDDCGKKQHQDPRFQ